MSSLAEKRRIIGQQAEAAVTTALETEGFVVRNLNELVGNCPFADLLARRNNVRLLIQVKGTVTVEGKFTTPPQRVRALETISHELGCHAIYAFVHLTGGQTVIRFAVAARVAELADEEESAYLGINRYHVTIDQFTIDASHIGELLSADIGNML